MKPGDLVIYHVSKGDPKPVLLLRFLSKKKAVIMLAGRERNVFVCSLRAIV
jgi:hypothetical protein